MSIWNPEYRILINGNNATGLTLVGFNITSGRTNVNTQPQAGYANLQIINKKSNSQLTSSIIIVNHCIYNHCSF